MPSYLIVLWAWRRSIGNSAKQKKYIIHDHYLNMIIVAKDYDDNGARGSGVLMVSKQDNSDDVMLILFKGPDITNSKIEKIVDPCYLLTLNVNR